MEQLKICCGRNEKDIGTRLEIVKQQANEQKHTCTHWVDVPKIDGNDKMKKICFYRRD